MSAGLAVKLLIRTAPRTPCAPATAPTHTRFSAALTANSPRRPRSGGAGRSAGGLCGLLRAGLRLGLRRRFLWRFVVLRFGGDARVAKEARDGVARQGAAPEPMLDAILFQRHALGMAAVEHRVVGAQLFDKAAVARAARVGDDDRIERPLFGAAASEPDFQ